MPHSIDNVCSFLIDESIPCLIVQWHGYATSSQVRKIAERQLQLMIENNLTKVISDIRDAKMVSKEDQEWIATEWLPRALEAGYEVCASIIAKDYFAQISMENIITKVGDKLTIQNFDDIGKAKEWLRNFPSEKISPKENLAEESSEAEITE